MFVVVSIPRHKYRFITRHLFQGHKEEGCFLFMDTHFSHAVVSLYVKEVHLIRADKWDYQSSFHLELNEEEKVRVMLKARHNNYDLIECHSHRSAGAANFSSSDRSGLSEFVRYVWWKLPGKIYGAMVWTKNDVTGEVWLPKRDSPLAVSEIRIIN